MRARALVSIVSLVLAAAGCATMDPREDTRIEAEVKARLVAERQADLTRLGVVSSNGTVHLSGTVGSAEEREQAAAVARGVRGVKRVVNTVEVGAPAR
ncbi:MAG TPA: BON domain-containing protein [Candidatus Tectomicrobia bacterium]|nr:BON domain-containing protein [Candidatus Tectomicrobia bacterium]